HLGELQLKGKSAPMAPWRLLELAATDAPPPAPASRMVGRDVELRVLQAAFDDARNQRRCHAVTVLGPAGIRQACLRAPLPETPPESATAVVGRCLSYGEGITFWPLAEMLEQLAGRADQDAIAALMGDDEQGRWAAGRLARAVGLASGPAAIEEIQLAVRRL